MKFRLGHITHHQTVMLDIMSYLHRLPALHLLWQASSLSRSYAVKSYHPYFLFNLHPKFEALSDEVFKKTHILLDDPNFDPAFIYILRYGKFKGDIIVGSMAGAILRYQYKELSIVDHALD
jgi:hypothetical protein